MASFCCYDSSDVSAILIITNFPLYLIQLWWQFFPNASLWRGSLCPNLAGIDSEKLYRATFICQYGLFCCMALVSFRLFCKNLGNLQEFFGQMDYRPPPPPPGKKLPVHLCDSGQWLRIISGAPNENIVQNHLNIACSKRSGSGERCEVKKAMLRTAPTI